MRVSNRDEARRDRISGRSARLIVADDHALARAGLSSLLKGERGLLVVGEAVNGREALDLCSRLRPDLVLIDIRMPDMDGLSFTRAVKRELPSVRVIVLTLDGDPATLMEAMRSGADAYVTKGTSKAEIIEEIRCVLRRDSPISPMLAGRLLDLVTASKLASNSWLAGLLTPTHVAALRLRAAGASHAVIGRELGLEPPEVSAALGEILTRLREQELDAR